MGPPPTWSRHWISVTVCLAGPDLTAMVQALPCVCLALPFPPTVQTFAFSLCVWLSATLATSGQRCSAWLTTSDCVRSVSPTRLVSRIGRPTPDRQNSTDPLPPPRSALASVFLLDRIFSDIGFGNGRNIESYNGQSSASDTTWKTRS